MQFTVSSHQVPNARWLPPPRRGQAVRQVKSLQQQSLGIAVKMPHFPEVSSRSVAVSRWPTPLILTWWRHSRGGPDPRTERRSLGGEPRYNIPTYDYPKE